jgi:L-ascorbate metabolism protein UlaG (beta-lactamase superfamily)
MKVTFVGHATILVEGNKNVIIDPFFNGNPAAALKIEDLPKIDYIVVTHGHGDHLGDTIEIAKKHGSTVITNFEIGLYLQRKGIDKVHTMHIGGKYDFGDIKVKLTPAVHGSAIIEDGNIIYGGNPAGVIVEMEHRKVFHSGDTGLTKDFELLANDYIDLAFVPIGGNYTMDIDDAFIATKMIQPKMVAPMHYNTWPLIEADPEKFCQKVSEIGIKCRVLKTGESVEI